MPSTRSVQLGITLLIGCCMESISSYGFGFGGLGAGGLGLGFGLWGGYPGFGFPWLAPPLGFQIDSGSIFGSPGIGFYNPGPRKSYITYEANLGVSGTGGKPGAGPPPKGAQPAAPPIPSPIDKANVGSQTTPGNSVANSIPSRGAGGLASAGATGAGNVAAGGQSQGGTVGGASGSGGESGNSAGSGSGGRGIGSGSSGR